MGAVNCPGCGTQVAAGTTICPKCDFILDTSFLEAPGSPPPASSGEHTQPRARVPEPPPKRPTTGSAKAVARPPSGSAKPATRPASGSARAAPRPAKTPTGAVRARAKTVGDDENTPPRGTKAMPDAPQRVVKEKRERLDYAALQKEYGQAPPPEHKPEIGVQKIGDADAAIADARAFISSLTPPDKLALVGAGLVVLLSFFPWKTTAADGEVIGVVSNAIFATFAAAFAAGAIYVRVQRVSPGLSPIVPWLIQLAATAFCIIWCLVFIRLSWDSTQVAAVDGNVRQAVSRPDIGVFGGLMAAIVALTGTLMGLKQR